MKIFGKLFLGAVLAGGAVLGAGDLVKDPIDTPQAVAKWSNAKMMQFLPTGGPEGEPAVKITPADAKGINCELPLDITKIRGKILEASADIKGDDITKPEHSYLGIKLMFRVILADGKANYPDIAPETKKTGTFDWSEYKVKARIPEDAKSVYLVIGLQGATGTVYYSDLGVDIED